MNERAMPRVIGDNIRRLRGSRAMSLSALARRSGVAKATLSVLESGSANPTVATLEALAGALEVPLGELLTLDGHSTTRVVRVDDETFAATDDRLVDSFTPHGLVEVYDVHLGPGRRFVYPAHSAGTSERLIVTSGSVHVGPTDDLVEVGPGDLVVFPADRPHEYRTDDGAHATLVVTYPAALPEASPIHAKSRE